MWLVGSLFFFYAFFQRLAPSVMVPELMRDFSVTALALGNLSAFYFWSYTSVQLPTGILADYWGPRRLLVGAAAVCGAGSFMFATSDSLWAASIGRLLVGLGAGFGFVCTLLIIAKWFPPRRLALLSGGTMMFGMLGGVGGQAPLAAVVAEHGWRPAMMAAGLFGIVLSMAAWLIVRDNRPVATGETARQVESGASLVMGIRRALGRRQTWLIAGFGFFLLPPMFAFGALWGVPYLTQIHGLSRPDAAFSASLILLGWGLFAPVVGWLSDKWRRRKPAMVVAAALNCLTMALLIYMPGWSPLMIKLILLANGIATGGMVVMFAMGREHNRPADTGAALAIVNMAVIGSGAAFQPLVGWLLDRGWTGIMMDGVRVYSETAYNDAFLVIPISCALATILALSVRETYAEPKMD